MSTTDTFRVMAGGWLTRPKSPAYREVYVQSFPSAGSKWTVSVAGGAEACAGEATTELFYLSAGTPRDERVNRRCTTTSRLA